MAVGQQIEQDEQLVWIFFHHVGQGFQAEGAGSRTVEAGTTEKGVGEKQFFLVAEVAQNDQGLVLGQFFQMDDGQDLAFHAQPKQQAQGLEPEVFVAGFEQGGQQEGQFGRFTGRGRIVRRPPVDEGQGLLGQRQ